jgi:hypothetical protein
VNRIQTHKFFNTPLAPLARGEVVLSFIKSEAILRSEIRGVSFFVIFSPFLSSLARGEVVLSFTKSEAI